ncbi:MAG: MMPL family transporter [Bacteroidota bacterium]
MNAGKFSIISFTVLALASAWFAINLEFAFNLEQFFPEGDEELSFYREFIEEFETDINFLLVAVERKEGIFDREFLDQFHDLTLKSRALPHITESQSLTKMAYPLKTPFGITTVPIIHRDQPEKYEKDKARLLNDARFTNSLISADATALVLALKTDNSLQLEPAQSLMGGLEELLESYSFDDYHIMGPPYFTREMVSMQKREVTVSAIVSGLLVSLIMFWIFRRPWGIFISLISIGLGLLLFLGTLGALGRPLNAMAALYPVLMIIVGTSDVIHIMSKYIDELRKGLSRMDAIKVAMKEIGLATLLTSTTTAIGLAALATSRIGPIRDFGLNAALGVMIAYVTVIFFTTALLSMFRADQIIKLGRGQAFWENLMERTYQLTLHHPKSIAFGSLLTLGIALWGISLVTTNYRLESNLPRGAKISDDFRYFENTFAGFRPMELAVFCQGDYDANSYEVLKEMDKVENYLEEQPSIRSINSLTTVYKSINQMYYNNKPEAYKMPETKARYARYKKLVSKLPENGNKILTSKDNKKGRITSRVLDMGSDSVKALSGRIDQWITANTDSTIAEFKLTGTGLILDKNAEYIRRNLLEGLGLAVVIISLLMALLFRNARMVLVSLVPNVFPLLMAGALLGFLNIELEAGISIIFAIVFGIAVDDSIHFLSKFKLARNKGMSVEESLHITFLETGKAICLTSVVLFFGFLVMLFSIHPPSVTVGLLISLTLVSALLADLLTLPVLIRWLIKDKD